MPLINLENDLHAIADKVGDLGDTPGTSRNTQTAISRAVVALRDAADEVGWDLMRANNEENDPSAG